MEKTGGYEEIYRDLVRALKSIHLADSAKFLGLSSDTSGHLEIPFLGRTFLLGKDGVHLQDGREAGLAKGAVLAGYVLRGGSGEPAGRFASLDWLFERTPSRNTYMGNRLEARLARQADRDPVHFRGILEQWGGQPEGTTGSGGESWVIELLPKIPVQLVFYPGDDEFPPEVRLLFDLTAPNFLEYEFLAVLATIFVDEIIKRIEAPQAWADGELQERGWCSDRLEDPRGS